MRKNGALGDILEEHIKKLLARDDLDVADQIKLLDSGVKLVAAQAKLKEPDDSDGAFFRSRANAPK
jgi:hypothetical protein